ncbi:hypothetical protein EYF80_038781 [Liparis tanakae]|uniref:Uncharacterized protein n=1 Tax=Liparis tanakae TaxID=230148 RepID=A0A4Z2GC79_9TELE|nr:hypothetical protein EYF80_038781 [Liparis tanakae]
MTPFEERRDERFDRRVGDGSQSGTSEEELSAESLHGAQADIPSERRFQMSCGDEQPGKQAPEALARSTGYEEFN